MSRKPLSYLAVAMMAATVQLSGCGKIPNQSSTPPSHQHVTPPGNQQVAQEPVSDLRRIHQDMLAALDLTDQQKAQIREIKARHRAEMRTGQLRTQLEQLRTMVLAPTVDKAALVQAILALEETKRGKMAHVAAMLGEIRPVLTERQRATAGRMIHDRWDEVLTAIHALRAEAMDDLSANLNLTEAQAGALRRLRMADRQATDTFLTDAHEAVMQFMMDGNQQNLATSFQNALAADRFADIVDDSADLVVSLNPVQRQQLVANYTSVLTKFKALHRAMHADMGMGGSPADGSDRDDD